MPAFDHCPDRSKLCDGCRQNAMTHLEGPAMCRGEDWAQRTAKHVRPVDRPQWPAFEADSKVARIALGLVSDLASDPALRELLAASCNASAAKAWKAMTRN